MINKNDNIYVKKSEITEFTVFDPTILNKDGNMKIDWNNPDIFKIIGLPLIMKEAGNEK